MIAKTPCLRSKLLIGVSIGAMLLTGVAEAQSGRGRGATSEGADAAVRAAQAQASQQAAQASSASQRAIAAFRRAADGRAAMQTAQAAARAAAQAAQSNIPNGLGRGGLQVADGVALDPNLWIGAHGPTQSVGADGRAQVVVEQTQSKAILTWDSFNVGRETDLNFNQQGADWVALNRVTDVSLDPSKILGSIKAQGSVYIINRNGVIFGGASQVNVRNLIASSANISNDQFLNQGIYSNLAAANYVSSFTGAGGKVTVEAGARITTHTPQSVTSGGGFVLLMGTEVLNAGTITTPRGQTALVAGDDFILRRGYGTEENKYSTTRGNEVRGLIHAGSLSGTVTNTGLMEAIQGDLTLAGRTIRQDGVMVATSSVNQRGTIHLLNSASDAKGSVTLGQNSLTLILPELDSKETALNGQRDALIKESETANASRGVTTNGGFDDRSLLADRLDQGRVEIVTGGDVTFEGGSNVMVNGGQVAVQANSGRITVNDGAVIDVSGTMGVSLDVGSNTIKVNIQGNELRDSPGNRDSDGLKSRDVWVDVRDLILLPSGTGGYEGDRWYTPGGLLEVGGYLANTAHGIGEWTAVGGTITLSSKEVVAKTGAVFDLSGGSIDYKSGYVISTRLLGSDGRMYDVRNAPAGMTFISVGNAFVRSHDRWGTQYAEVYANPLFSRANSSRWEEGYTVGRDAGRLILSTPTAIMEAQILAGVINGERQTQARPQDVRDGYSLGANTVAKAGTLAIGGYTALGATNPQNVDIRIGEVENVANDAAAGQALPADRIGTAWLDTDYLNAQGLGGLELLTARTIAVEGDLVLANGGSVALIAPKVDITGSVTAHGGSFVASNVLRSTISMIPPRRLTLNGQAGFSLADGAQIDVSGEWVNANRTSSAPNLGFINGGDVRVDFTHDVNIEAGSRIDVSSGGAVLNDAHTRGGRGGNLTLRANTLVDAIETGGVLRLDGTLAGYGVDGGGSLSLETGGKVLIGGDRPESHSGLFLSKDRFSSGFSSYDVNGHGGVRVADGAVIDVTMPVYRFIGDSLDAPSGTKPADALELWTAPLHQDDPRASVLTQRGGASLSLRSVRNLSGGAIEIGEGAVVSVDPGQAIRLLGRGQLTVNGRLNAWGGLISIDQVRFADTLNAPAHNRSIWIGDNAVLDVAGRAFTATDANGRRYGLVQDGGRIELGGKLNWEIEGEIDMRPADLHLVIRKGALLDASGANAVLDLPGLDKNATWRPVTVGGAGGTIVLSSSVGMHLDGEMRAAAGAPGAAGGKLGVFFGGAIYAPAGVTPEALIPRYMTLTQNRTDSVLSDGLQAGQADAGLTYGHGALSVEQIHDGGFGSLSVQAGVHLTGDLNLEMSESLRLSTPPVAAPGAPDPLNVRLAAPHVHLGAIISTPLPGENYVYPGSIQPDDNRDDRITIEGDLIDVRNMVQFLGYGDVDLISRGDIRLLRPTYMTYANRELTLLLASKQIQLTAAQIYPVTGAAGAIGVGVPLPGDFKQPLDGRLIIKSNGGPTPAQPYSAYGSLDLWASNIEQGGILRAPFGSITFGHEIGSYPVHTVLMPGSITSVSGAGLLMPYGGTVDGVRYIYDGKVIELNPQGWTSNGAPTITMNVASLDTREGSVMDLSGGGELTGAGFISGRGGSVDVLRVPFADANPGFGFSQSGNQVYALVPGYVGYAPSAENAGAGAPGLGRQVTIPEGVPGLAAGTYTLMPSTYALLPGAFRVEIGQGVTPDLSGVTSTGAGSFIAAGYLGTLNTGQRDVQASALLITPADMVRKHTGYNETSLNAFVLADAARRNLPRSRLTDDAGHLALNFTAGAGLGDTRAMTIKGVTRLSAAADSKGYGGSLGVGGRVQSIEILAAGDRAEVVGASGIALFADDLNALTPSRMSIGGNFMTDTVVLRSGATLSAPEVSLTAVSGGRGIVVEQGATISTIGRGAADFDSTNGYFYTPNYSTLVVSNGWVNLLPPALVQNGQATVDLGGCLTVCSGETRIVSEGTIGVATFGAFTLGDAVSYGARHLVLGVSAVNLGAAETLANAAAAGQLPPGMALNQDVLKRLLAGNTAIGAPALETLSLNARESINLYGTVDLDTYDSTGKSVLERLVFGAPAMYGYGAASDTVTIRTGEFIWAGTTGANAGGLNTNNPSDNTGLPPGAAVLDRLGDSVLNIIADTIRFDYAPNTLPVRLVSADRLALGFSTVNLTASKGVFADAKGSLNIYHKQNGYVAGQGWQYSGGNLNITAPLLTAGAGAVLSVNAGGAVDIRGGGAAFDPIKALGGELRIAGQSIRLDTAVVLPSGRLVLNAVDDVTLGDQARIDLAGREIEMFDVKKYSWGGDLVLSSRDGDILAHAGSAIDLSAQYNRGGSLTATALGEQAGRVDLLGAIKGKASGVYDAGGTLVPYDAAELTVRARVLEDFAGLNGRLNEGEVFGARRFQIKQGDLVVGDEVKAREVQIVLDGGDLTINGRIDASGYQVGAIRLSASGDLKVNGALDAHGTGLRRDSYGKIIESPNRALVELTARDGRLVLGANTVIDLRAGTDSPFADGQARGTLDLMAPRIGANDVAIDVLGAVDIRGARTTAVYGFRTYDDAPLSSLPDVSGHRPQLITQAYMDALDIDSRAFMNAALVNTGLSARLSGLGDYHLRPGVEIVSNATTNPGGHLTVLGDIDLSNHRYGPNANRADPALRGFGEPGMLVIRAAGDVNVHGSINDGFAPPPLTPDDNGWLLEETRDNTGGGLTPFAGDIIVPIDGVQLDTGTVFKVGTRLNYDIPVRNVTLPAGTTAPVPVTLNGPLTLPAGLVLSAEVRTANGVVYRAGTVLPEALTLTKGATLGAGFQLRADAPVQAFTWPKGVALPADLTTSERITLARGSLIPSMTKVELPGGQPVNLRPVGPDGTQGRNWALAPMLREGSTSWDLTLVAGADMGSSDRTARNAFGTGDIILADAHNASIGKVTIRYEGGGGGKLVFTKEAAMTWFADASFGGLTGDELDAKLMAEWGLTFVDYFGEPFSDYCTNNPADCQQVADDGLEWFFSAAGADDFFGEPSLAGKTQAEINQWLIDNWGLDWDYLLNGAPLAKVCADNPGSCYSSFTDPVLTVDGATGWIGDEKYAGLGSAALEAALQADYGMSVADFFGASLKDFCNANASLCAVQGSTPPVEVREYAVGPGGSNFSVIRTGAGDMTLIAGRDVRMSSMFGVYTAGVQTTLTGVDNAQFNLPRNAEYQIGKTFGTDSPYLPAWNAWNAWYPDLGGNLTIAAGRDVTGDTWGANAQNSVRYPEQQQAQYASSSLGNWLWRQGTGNTLGVDPVATSWWINFGAYANDQPSLAYYSARIVGFTGFGALGGGNVSINADRHAGIVDPRGGGLVTTTGPGDRTQGLVVAIGSTGRVVGDDLYLTGGGDLNLRTGGLLNPNARATQVRPGSGSTRATGDVADLNGVLTNLRGNLTLTTSGMGAYGLLYGGDGGGLRPDNPFAAGSVNGMGGPLVMLGDAVAWVNTRGDLVLGGAGDPGRVKQATTQAWSAGAESAAGGGLSWLSLWTPNTAVNLFSAGGDLMPMSMTGSVTISTNMPVEVMPDRTVVYPSILRAVATSGNIYMAPFNNLNGESQLYPVTLLLAPSAKGQLELLAGGSIRGGATRSAIVQSGSDVALPSPFNPAFGVISWPNLKYGNLSIDGLQASLDMPTLFAFGPNTLTRGSLHIGDPTPARFYAVNGDIVGLTIGRISTWNDYVYNQPRTISTWYQGATAVQLRAGQDVLGVNVLAVNNNARDISMVQAGRDIVHADITVAGPGALEVYAGRNLLQEDVAGIRSIGSIVQGDTRPGAAVSLSAGMSNVDWNKVRDLYLNPDNLLAANPDGQTPPLEGSGKVAKVYNRELTDWLGERHGFTGTQEQALALFDTLAPEEQRIFLRQIYYAELREGGREYNDVAGPRFGSYLRGRQMIAALFPDKDAHGSDLHRAGDILMYGGAGVRTDFGGNIEMMAPGGQIVVGVQGVVPPGTAGIVSQGQGDIRLFSEKSLLLGLSRIMTTFGGDIFAWSEEGDINAGRGAKSTIVYTPARRIYDAYGNVRLAPQVPSSGAGIATLNPIPEVAAGDVDLIAPLGTIDAGEAGIRVSGNVNLAALRVLNAANIQVQGESKGIPLPPVVNTSALTAASVIAEAARVAERARPVRTEVPTILSVRFLGFGE
ncbi:filamentous haemagglutinin family protein [Brevundimonas sp.]|uniref:filamentous haemagglutinin family protein n=1 Tax=Brevundimonas sp. TaxID=1871086 RepID=UPI0025BF2ECE|nr:filamentous haemagglutinin family protein [Brevundimonas sp.]